MKRLLLSFVLLISMLGTPLQAAAADFTAAQAGWKKYLPDIHGVLRPRFEIDTDDGHARFQMRHARLSLGGDIGAFSYFFNTDFCDQGKVKALDYWVGARATHDLYFQVGQFRVPFGVDPFRGPANSFFANRSFLGKQMWNVRAVGLMAQYSLSSLPLTMQAAFFNPGTIGDHSQWHTKFAYAAKATLKLDDFSISGSFMSGRPAATRVNLADAALGWAHDRWTTGAEYMYKHYTSHSHRAAHGWLCYADYHFPVKAGIFNQMSAQLRWDGMTAHSAATTATAEGLTTDDAARNRITAGMTISYIRSKDVHVDLRLDYEKYFYHHDASPAVGNSDKAVLDLVLSF